MLNFNILLTDTDTKAGANTKAVPEFCSDEHSRSDNLISTSVDPYPKVSVFASLQILAVIAI